MAANTSSSETLRGLPIRKRIAVHQKPDKPYRFGDPGRGGRAL
jgi:hypothetical protein